MRRLLLSAVMILLVSVPAYAGWVQVDKGGDRTIISDGMIKEMSKGESHYSVLDAKKGNIILVDTGKRVYVSDSIDNFCNTLAGAMAQAMKGMPKEARAAMEKMRGQKNKPPRVTVEKVGDGGTIAGYRTVKYRVLADGRNYQELWLTRDAAIMKEMGKLYPAVMNKVSGCEARMSPLAGGTLSVEDSPAYRRIEASGWEMKAITHSGMVNSSSEVVSLKQKSIPSSEFAIPAGYRRVSLRQMMFQR